MQQGLESQHSADAFARTGSSVVPHPKMTLSADILKARFPKAVGIKLPYTVSQTASVPPGGVVIEHATTICTQYRERQYQYRTDNVRVTKVRAGQVVFGFDYIFTPDKSLLADSGYAGVDTTNSWWFPHAVEGDKVLHAWPSTVTHIDEDVLYMGGPPTFHIGHWIVDFLPRLRAREIAPMKIAIPQQLFPKLRELLAVCDVRPEEIIECELGWRYQFRNIYVVQKGAAHRPTPGNIGFLQRHMRPTLTKAPNKRTWIDRGVPTRRALNMDSVGQVLTHLGFERVTLSAMTIAEQAAQIGRSQIVVATYGSDLEASLFMQPGTHLVELRYALIADESFAIATCSFMGLHYHQLICSEEYEVASMKKDRNFVVDCEALEAMLSAIIGRSLPSDS